MSKTTTTSFFSWRGAFQIALAVAAFLMVDPYIRKLLSFVQEHCIAELSPHWFGAFVCLLVVCCCYILPRRYKRTYIPVQLRWGLLLLAAAYLYYRLSPCCYYRLKPRVLLLENTIRRLDGIPCNLDGPPILTMAIRNGMAWCFTLPDVKLEILQEDTLLDSGCMVKAKTTVCAESGGHPPRDKSTFFKSK